MKKQDVKAEEKAKTEKAPEVEADTKKEVKAEEKAKAEKAPGVKEDVKAEVKTEEKKVVKQKEIPKKDVAIANGFSLKISPKQSKYIMRTIRGKTPEAAVVRLQDVIDGKRPVPMAGLEVGHKKGKGLAGGKFPKNACKAIIEIVKQAGANAVVAGIESPVITIAKADRAAAPYRKAGRKAKRAHIHIEVQDKIKLMEKKK